MVPWTADADADDDNSIINNRIDIDSNILSSLLPIIDSHDPYTYPYPYSSDALERDRDSYSRFRSPFEFSNDVDKGISMASHYQHNGGYHHYDDELDTLNRVSRMSSRTRSRRLMTRTRITPLPHYQQ